MAMLPFQTSYVLQAVGGSAPLVMAIPSGNVPLCSLVTIPQDGGRSTKSNVRERKHSKVAESFEIIAKRNGIKVSNPAVGDCEDNTGQEKLQDESEKKLSAADYFEIVARRNGIRVTSPGDVQNENGVREHGPSFVTRGHLSPLAKTFSSRNNSYETGHVSSVSEYYWREDYSEFDHTAFASSSNAENEAADETSVDNADVLKMFEMVLEEKKQFEKKQFQILQEYIKEIKNSKKEIDSLTGDKIELQDKNNALTSKLEASENKMQTLKSEKDSAHDEGLLQYMRVSKGLSENILALKERNGLLSNEVEVMTEKIMELTEMDIRLKTEVITLTSRLEESKKMNDRRTLSDLKHEAIAECFRLSREVETMTGQFREYDIVNTRLSEEAEEFTEQLRECENVNTRLSKETEKLTEQLRECESVNTRLSKEMEVMTEQLRQCKRMNTRKNFVDMCTQTESCHVNSVPDTQTEWRPFNHISSTQKEPPNSNNIPSTLTEPRHSKILPASQTLRSTKKRHVGSMDSLDKITLESCDEWTVVNRRRSTKGTTENSPLYPPPEQVVTKPRRLNRSGSLCEASLNKGRDSPCLGACERRGSVDVPAPVIDCNHMRDVIQPMLSKSEMVSVAADKDRASPVDVSKSNAHSVYVDESWETNTFLPSPLDAETTVDDTISSVHRRSSKDDSLLATGNVTSRHYSVNPDAETSIIDAESLPFSDTESLPFSDTESLPFADAKSLPFDDDTTSSVCGTKLSSEVEANDIEARTAVPTSSIANAATITKGPNIVNEIPIASNIPIQQSLANLDALAKQLGFGENWHQNILNSCSGLPAVVPVPVYPVSLDPASTQMFCNPGVPNAALTQQVSGTDSTGPSHIAYGQPELSGQFSNSVTNMINSEAKNSGGNAPQYNTSSFQRLMTTLSEKFPAKTRGDIIIYLKKAKSSFGEQGFRKKKQEEIVKRVGDLIQQDKMSNKTCCICCDVLEDDEKTLECGHRFHGECVSEWISTERTCPLCRTHALTQEDFPKLG